VTSRGEFASTLARLCSTEADCEETYFGLLSDVDRLHFIAYAPFVTPDMVDDAAARMKRHHGGTTELVRALPAATDQAHLLGKLKVADLVYAVTRCGKKLRREAWEWLTAYPHRRVRFEVAACSYAPQDLRRRALDLRTKSGAPLRAGKGASLPWTTITSVVSCESDALELVECGDVKVIEAVLYAKLGYPAVIRRALWTLASHPDLPDVDHRALFGPFSPLSEELRRFWKETSGPLRNRMAALAAHAEHVSEELLVGKDAREPRSAAIASGELARVLEVAREKPLNRTELESALQIAGVLHLKPDQSPMDVVAWAKLMDEYAEPDALAFILEKRNFGKVYARHFPPDHAARHVGLDLLAQVWGADAVADWVRRTSPSGRVDLGKAQDPDVAAVDALAD